MDGIEHRTVLVNGINMHVAEMGHGPRVFLLLHGFPEIWYTWRHQIRALASLGYRAVAPDLRGFGGSDSPPDPSAYTYHHVVADLVALLDSLGADKAFVVAHDWGAMVGWFLCLFRPDRVRAFVSLTVPYRPRNPAVKPVAGMRAFLGEDYYMCRFQAAGDIESEIESAGVRNVLLKILSERRPGPPMLPKGGFLEMGAIDLPSWLSEEDLQYYAASFEKTGFTGGLNYYRAIDLNWELTAPWNGAKVTVPVKFIVGDLDMTYTTPGVKDYVHHGGFKKDVPLLDDEIVVMEDAGHFINQERPEEVNALIHEFIKKF
ncbi:hypothetical protein SAY87_003391 [Trapa incisa]|uniref:soluble epoxide hydrolase n=1 Tax=Trapa incisa TaxID=236973 RepID=A0AAN7KRA5_9MYRT|nr:hypothetical protein SAY87_003391 [Trapa incisa]